MNILFIGILLLICALICQYLIPIKKNYKLFAFFYFVSLSCITTIYLLFGDNQYLNFYEELEKDIETSAEIDPEKFIILLERKIKQNPIDLESIQILARTCFLTGYIQKANLYYNMALDYFPANEKLLFEVVIFKRTTKDAKGALISAEKLVEKNPTKSENIILLVDVYLDLRMIQKAEDKLLKLQKLSKNQVLIEKIESKIADFYESSKK